MSLLLHMTRHDLLYLRKVEETAISEVEVHLKNALIEEEEKAREVSSIR